MLNLPTIIALLSNRKAGVDERQARIQMDLHDWPTVHYLPTYIKSTEDLPPCSCVLASLPETWSLPGTYRPAFYCRVVQQRWPLMSRYTSYQPLKEVESSSGTESCHTCHFPPSGYARREKRNATIVSVLLILSNLCTWFLSRQVLYGSSGSKIDPRTPYGMFPYPCWHSVPLTEYFSTSQFGTQSPRPLCKKYPVHQSQRNSGQQALGRHQHRRRDGGTPRRIRSSPRAANRTALPLGPLKRHLPPKRPPQPPLHSKRPNFPHPCPLPPFPFSNPSIQSSAKPQPTREHSTSH